VVLYVVLGEVWRLSALGGVCGLLAWSWTLERAASYADLVEAVIEVYVDDRFDGEARLSRPGTGRDVTEEFRKRRRARHL
jgi:hypothetical protein